MYKLIQDVEAHRPLITIHQWLIAQLPRHHFYTIYQIPGTNYDTMPEKTIWDVRRVK